MRQWDRQHLKDRRASYAVRALRSLELTFPAIIDRPVAEIDRKTVRAAIDAADVNRQGAIDPGQQIVVLVTDDRSLYPVRINLAGGAAERLMPPPVVVNSPTAAGACTAVVASFGGYVARYQGDGLMAYFGYPQAREDAA